MIKPIKLGKPIKLKYVRFSQLISPSKICLTHEFGDIGYDVTKQETSRTISICNSRPLRTIKRDTLESLKLSIMRFGLLNPLSITEISNEKLLEKINRLSEIDREIYAILDGQRRYFAIKELLTNYKWSYHQEYDDYRNVQLMRDWSKYNDKTIDSIMKFDLRRYILVPCLIYPFESWEECMRYSIEDNKFSVRPSTENLEIAERLPSNLPNIKSEIDLSSIDEKKKEIGEGKIQFQDKINEVQKRLEVKRAEQEKKAKIKLLEEQTKAKIEAIKKGDYVETVEDINQDFLNEMSGH